MDEALRQRIHDLVNNHKVVLFMKGTRHFPQCGFSGAVIQVLNRRLREADRRLAGYQRGEGKGAPAAEPPAEPWHSERPPPKALDEVDLE